MNSGHLWNPSRCQRRFRWIAASAILFVIAVALRPPRGIAAPMDTAPPPTADDYHREVVRNILDQPVGTWTVADDRLPAEFVDRVANRILQASYEDRFRIIVTDAASRPASSQPSDAVSSQQPSDDGVKRLWPKAAMFGALGLIAVLLAVVRRRGPRP